MRVLLMALLMATCLGAAETPAAMGHVWPQLKEAQAASAHSKNPILMVVPDSSERKAYFTEVLETLDGVKIRAAAEVWLAEREEPAVRSLLDRLALRSLPALVLLDESGTRLRTFRLGEDCVPAREAMLSLLSDDVDSPRVEERLRAWTGEQDVRHFLEFAKALKERPMAAAEPGFSAWLQGFLDAKNPHLRDWAATRLVEAGVFEPVRQLNPISLLLAYKTSEFQDQVKRGNQGWNSEDLWNLKEIARNPNPPVSSLRKTGDLDSRSPFWPILRNQLSGSLSPELINLAGYALMAPQLQAEDQAWIEKQLRKSGLEHQAKVRHLSSPVYNLAVEWLMVYGAPSDWQAFEALMTESEWKSAFGVLRKSLEALPSYWGSSPRLAGLVCGGGSESTFWENPDPCLATWGITREKLVFLGMNQPKLRRRATGLAYPAEAKRMRISGTVIMGLLLDEQGRIKWIRPKPGLVLPVLGEAALSYASQMEFEPSMAGGLPHASTFRLTMPFSLTEETFEKMGKGSRGGKSGNWK